MEKTCKVYQASTSEEFGNTTDGTTLLDENSLKIPVSIYGVSKLAAEHLCRIYRDAYEMFVVSSTLFNHEGPRRGHTFVTQKIANYVAKWNSGKVDMPLNLGNLNSYRDWGSAKDYVEAVWMMMQKEIPDNYVIATGETHSVKEFVELSFKEVNVDIEWSGENVNEIGTNKKTGEVLVKVNPKYFRDLELDVLIGNADKAKRVLGWQPKTSFNELVKEMVHAAIKSNSL
jgi:GDPmannose 4,6-dehydratase